MIKFLSLLTKRPVFLQNISGNPTTVMDTCFHSATCQMRLCIKMHGTISVFGAHRTVTTAIYHRLLYPSLVFCLKYTAIPVLECNIQLISCLILYSRNQLSGTRKISRTLLLVILALFYKSQFAPARNVFFRFCKYTRVMKEAAN